MHCISSSLKSYDRNYGSLFSPQNNTTFYMIQQFCLFFFRNLSLHLIIRFFFIKIIKIIETCLQFTFLFYSLQLQVYISQFGRCNYKFIFRNYEFIFCSYDFISHNSEIIFCKSEFILKLSLYFTMLKKVFFFQLFFLFLK